MSLFTKTWLLLLMCFPVPVVFGQSVGGTTSGALSDCDSTNSGFISLTGHTGIILFWEASINGGATWIKIPNTVSVQSYSNLVKTTCYRATVQDGSFPPAISAVSCITIYTPTVGGVLSGGGLFCDSTGKGSITLGGQTGNVLSWQFSTDKGNTWTTVSNTSATLSYTNLYQSVRYKALVQNGPACKVEASSEVAFVISPSVGGTLSGGGTYCKSSGNGNLNLSGKVGSVKYWQYSTNNGTSWTNVLDTSSQFSYSNITTSTLYRAVVQNGAVCPADTSTQASIIIAPSKAGILFGADTVCYNAHTGALSLNGYKGSIVKWLISSTNGLSWKELATTSASHTYTNLKEKTLYKAIVQNGNCDPDTSNAIAIELFPRSIISVGNDTTITKGHAIHLKGKGTGVPAWLSSSGLSIDPVFDPIVQPQQTTNFILNVTDSYSCINSDTVVVYVKAAEYNGKIANLFTPNGDGINDTWYIEDIQLYPENEVVVYNIYGNEVFSEKGYANQWKGTYHGNELPDGTYYYVIRLGGNEKDLKGSLDIVKK